MSLFRGERVQPLSLIMEARSAPVSPVDGELWNDANQNALQLYKANISQAPTCTIVRNVTPVTATNPSSAANLMTFSVPAGALNAVGKTLLIKGQGNYTTASGQTPTVKIDVQLGGVSLVNWTSGATTASATTMPWQFTAYVVVQTKGSSGVFEAHGQLNLTLGTTATAGTTSYNDNNTAVSSAVDLTAAQSLTIQTLMSSSNAGNSVIQRLMVVELSN